VKLPPLYSEYARYYDVIYGRYLRQRVPRLADFAVEVFGREAEREVRDVLDIACGTGGPTVELARRGFNVVGVDVSPAMIEIARRRAAEAGVDVCFEVMDMRELRFEEEFDAVTCFFTSINYNVADEDLQRTLRGVLRALRGGGVFVADAPNPLASEQWLRGVPSVWRVDEEGISILVIDAVSMSNVSGLIDWSRTLLISEGGVLRMVADGHRLRAYTAGELKLHARIAGFRRARVYGDMRVTEEEPTSARRLFLVAVK